MTEGKFDSLAASFAASAAHRANRGLSSIQLTQVGSVAVLVAAMEMGYTAPKGDVKQYDSCRARVEVVDPVTGVVLKALMVNAKGGLWKDGKLSDGIIEAVTAKVTDKHRQIAEELIANGTITF